MDAAWRKLETVEIHNGYPPTEVGVATVWDTPGIFDGIDKAAIARTLENIRTGNWRENSQATDWVGRAIGEGLDINVSTDEGKTRVKEIIKTWLRNRVLIIERRKDKNSDERGFVVPGPVAP
jgi:hypothetical protein